MSIENSKLHDYNEIFKIKLLGVTLKIRRMHPDEKIDTKTLQRLSVEPNNINNYNLRPSKCINELVKDHPEREYFHIESKFIKDIKNLF